MFGWHVPAPNEAMLVSGGRQKGGSDALPFKIVTGHGAWVIRLLAQAEADRTRMSAQAAGSENRIALDQAIIAQLPQMITAASAGLSSANVTVLNGAEGLNGTVAALASQGMAILRAVTDGLGAPAVHHDSDGQPPRRASTQPELEPGEGGTRT